MNRVDMEEMMRVIGMGGIQAGGELKQIGTSVNK